MPHISLKVREGSSAAQRLLVSEALVTAIVDVREPHRALSNNEVPFHLEFALKDRVTREEIIETITHVAFYSGWPTADTALAIARKIFDGV